MQQPRRRFRDPVTGRMIWQVTDGDAMHHHLYFLTPTWSPDGRFLICVGYDDGAPNLLAIDARSGAQRPLTAIEDLTAFSACPARDGLGVYFTAGSQVRRVELADGHQRVLADFGDGLAGNCALSADGGWLVTNVRRGPTNAITAVSVAGEVREVLRTGREVGHVQFDPTPAMTVLYSGSLTERLWVVGADGRDDHLVYRQEPGELLVHEFWSPDGSEIRFVHWPFALRSIRPDGSRDRILVSNNAWHVSAGPAGLLVSDTNWPDVGLQLINPATGAIAPLCASASSNMGSQWRHTFPREGAHMDVTMFSRRAGAEETPWGPQWTHPHPSFHPKGGQVAFTSDRSGISQVYVVEGVPDRI